MADGGTDVDAVARREIEVEELRQARMARMAKGKALAAMKLPPLLAQRRLQYTIPDGCFSQFPLFDRVLLYQLGEKHQTDKIGSIYLPEVTQERLHDETPRGVIVGAGPKALDELRSNGVDLGHVVRFVKYTPYRLIVDFAANKQVTCLVLTSGSIVSSEDLEEERRSGTKTLVFDEESEEHRWHYGKTKARKAKQAWTPADG
jgi:co-chaperonin GroES (HSP10)